MRPSKIGEGVCVCVCMFQFSYRRSPGGSADRTIAAHARRHASVLVVFVVFCVHMHSFAGLIRRKPPPTISDTAITDHHSDTTFFQLRALWVLENSGIRVVHVHAKHYKHNEDGRTASGGAAMVLYR